MLSLLDAQAIVVGPPTALGPCPGGLIWNASCRMSSIGAEFHPYSWQVLCVCRRAAVD